MIKRDYLLDFLKTISMILVIVIHLSNYYCRNADNIITSNFIFSVIYDGLARICVPLFFMISGVVILGSKYDSRKYGTRIAKFVLILVFWSLAYYLWDIFYMHYEYNLVEDFFKVFFEPTKVHLWFMYPLIGLYIMAPFIQKLVNNIDEKLENLFILLWLGFSGGAHLFVTIAYNMDIPLKIVYPLALVQETYWLGYFVAGYIFYKRLQTVKGEKKYNKILIGAFVLSMAITIGVTIFYSVKDSVFYENLYEYRSIFIAVSSICVFCYVLINSERVLKTTLKKITGILVKYSFGIYLSHLLFYNILVKEFDVLKLNGAYAVPLFTVVIFLVSLSFTYILKKIPILKNVV